MAEQSVMDTPIFDELLKELKRATAAGQDATPQDDVAKENDR